MNPIYTPTKCTRRHFFRRHRDGRDKFAGSNSCPCQHKPLINLKRPSAAARAGCVCRDKNSLCYRRSPSAAKLFLSPYVRLLSQLAPAVESFSTVSTREGCARAPVQHAYAKCGRYISNAADIRSEFEVAAHDGTGTRGKEFGFSRHRVEPPIFRNGRQAAIALLVASNRRRTPQAPAGSRNAPKRGAQDRFAGCPVCRPKAKVSP